MEDFRTVILPKSSELDLAAAVPKRLSAMAYTAGTPLSIKKNQVSAMGVGGGADGPLDGSWEQLLGSDSLAAKSNLQWCPCRSDTTANQNKPLDLIGAMVSRTPMRFPAARWFEPTGDQSVLVTVSSFTDTATTAFLIFSRGNSFLLRESLKHSLRDRRGLPLPNPD